MIKVLSQASTEYLSPEHSLEWYDLRGREIAVVESEGRITLEIINSGNKKNTVAYTIATVTVADEVSEKYSEDERLKSTISAFANEHLSARMERLDRLIKSSLSVSGVVDFTGVPTVEIKVFERVERDDADEVVNTSIVAKIAGDESDYVYSSAGDGVFDRFEGQPEPQPAAPVAPATEETETAE